MQRYGDRLLGYSEARDAEAEVDYAEAQDPKVQSGEFKAPAESQASSSQPAKAVGEQAEPGPSAAGGDDKMDVDPPVPSTSEPAQPPPAPAPDAPPPSSTPAGSVNVAPKGKERDKSVNFAPPAASTSADNHALKSGLRDWVRNGDDVMGSVIGGRMTSPMRD